MTVSSQTSNETFYGNGVTTVWDLPFRFFDNADIHAYLVDPVTQVSTPIAQGSDYTLTGAGLPEQFGVAPGKITTTVPVADGKQLYVERVMDAEQLTDIVNQGRFFSEVHEDVFDRLTMLIQQVTTWLGRALIRPPGKNDYDAQNRKIINLADGQADQDATNIRTMRSYVDAAIAGVVGGFGYFLQAGVGAIMRTFQSKMRESMSVEDFGIYGDYDTDRYAQLIIADQAAFDAGKELLFPAGQYAMSNGFTPKARWRGEFAPQLAPFPLFGDDKKFLRPGFKKDMPGTSLFFKGTGTNSVTTQRADDYANFTYCIKLAEAGGRIRDMAIIRDCDVYDAAGNLTALGAENSAIYDAGLVIDDAAQCSVNDVVVFGYFPKAGAAIHSVLGNDDPDYNVFRGGSLMGRHGIALIGSQINDGFDSGLSGTQTYGTDIFTLDHHSRSPATAPAIYANADTWACIYIDGYTDAVQADINGHYFNGGSIRTYAIHPVILDAASQANFSMAIFETSNWPGVPNAATKQWLASAETQDVGITHCRFAGDVGLFSPSFGGIMKGQLSVMNCPGLAAGGGVIVSEKDPAVAVANWIKFGGASGGSGDPSIQFGSGSALSSTNGWSQRRDISADDIMTLRWNGVEATRLMTDGSTGRFGMGVGPTRTIAAGSITVAEYSYYRVANEGAAATDDLENILGGTYDGQLLILAAASSTQDVVLKDAVGNLRLTADFTMTHAQDRIQLQWDGAAWCEISRSDNTP